MRFWLPMPWARPIGARAYSMPIKTGTAAVAKLSAVPVFVSPAGDITNSTSWKGHALQQPTFGPLLSTLLVRATPVLLSQHYTLPGLLDTLKLLPQMSMVYRSR